jgi:hypothetical protein
MAASVLSQQRRIDAVQEPAADITSVVRSAEGVVRGLAELASAGLALVVR